MSTQMKQEPKPSAKRFVPGTLYYSRSVGDYDCIHLVEVVRRTEKSVWIRAVGRHYPDDIVRRAIRWRSRPAHSVEVFSDSTWYFCADSILPEGGIQELRNG